jgi:predicted outer membrane repeat protein
MSVKRIASFFCKYSKVLIIAVILLSDLCKVLTIVLPVQAAKLLASTTDERYVTPTGTDVGNDCINPATPCRSIVTAVSQAVSGDTIFVAQGIYYERILLEGKTLFIEGGWNPDFTVKISDPSFTIMDGSHEGTVWSLQGSSTYLVLNNLTIRNGRGPVSGGAINAIDVGGLTLNSVKLKDNHATVSGGAIYASNTVLIIEKSSFFENYIVATPSGSGGAIYSLDNTVSIFETNFVGNAAMNGAALYIKDQMESWIESSEFSMNRSASSVVPALAVVMFDNSNGTMQNNIIVQNSGTALLVRGDVQMKQNTVSNNSQYAITTESGSITGWNNILAYTTEIAVFNMGGTISLTNTLWWGNELNSIGIVTDTNPVIGNPSFINPLMGNFDIASDSAAVDFGVDADVNVDFLGRSRPSGSAPDIGAYEFQYPKWQLMLPFISKE